LWRALDPPIRDGSIIATRLVSGRASIDLLDHGTVKTQQVDFGSPVTTSDSDREKSVYFIDAASESRRYQAIFCQFNSIDDIINGEGGKELDQKSIQEIAFLLNREYRIIKLYEIDLGEIVPFFEVSYGDDRYDSRTMGGGEIAAFHMWWSISSLKRGQIALIEEPEAFLSHICQTNLAKHIVTEAVDRKFCAVVSTHSAPFINSLPEDALWFFSRTRLGMTAQTDKLHPAVLKSVGIDPPIRIVALVEDAAAAEFTRALLEKISPTFARQVRTIVRNGDGEITNSLRALSFYTGLPLFVGLYDGDMREKAPTDITNIAFLPGSTRVERMFRDMIYNNFPSFESAIGRKDLDIILTSLEGTDDHDWFRRLGDEVGMNYSQLFSFLINMWFRQDGNIEASSQTFDRLKSLSDSIED
jgi:hypothetical protein